MKSLEELTAALIWWQEAKLLVCTAEDCGTALFTQDIDIEHQPSCPNTPLFRDIFGPGNKQRLEYMRKLTGSPKDTTWQDYAQRHPSLTNITPHPRLTVRKYSYCLVQLSTGTDLHTTCQAQLGSWKTISNHFRQQHKDIEYEPILAKHQQWGATQTPEQPG
jgi:hypothetical protein